MFGREPKNINDKFDVKNFINRFFATLEHFGDYFTTWLISFIMKIFQKFIASFALYIDMGKIGGPGYFDYASFYNKRSLFLTDTIDYLGYASPRI